MIKSIKVRWQNAWCCKWRLVGDQWKPKRFIFISYFKSYLSFNVNRFKALERDWKVWQRFNFVSRFIFVINRKFVLRIWKEVNFIDEKTSNSYFYNFSTLKYFFTWPINKANTYGIAYQALLVDWKLNIVKDIHRKAW